MHDLNLFTVLSNPFQILDKLRIMSSPMQRGMTLSLVVQARASKLSENTILSASAPLLQTFIFISEGMNIPLSDETEVLLRQAKDAGISFHETYSRNPSRPLTAAPKGPPEFSIFVDESGTASFDEAPQPVLCLVGIIVKDKDIPGFEQASDRLLETYGLPKKFEIHAPEFLTTTPKRPLNKLKLDERYALLRDFLDLGMNHAVGIHHLSMLKSMVKPDYQKKMVTQGLNAYTHTVVWFLLTLDRVCLLIKLGTRYKYFYDRTDAYRKDIGIIFRTLKENTNECLRFFCLNDPPIMLYA